MEALLRASLIDWLQTDPALAVQLNLIAEEAPIAASAPWLGLVASASADWSTKTQVGREVRLAFELHTRGENPATAADLIAAIEARISQFPRMQSHYDLASLAFLKARSERRAGNRRVMLLEYRFRILQPALS